MPTFRRYLIAGLLIWVPLGITILVVRLLIKWLDGTVTLIPEAYRPETLLGFAIPGLGVLLSFIVVILTGLFVANLFGRKLVRLWEGFLSHVPLVRSVYSGAKQLAETMFSADGQSFRKVLLVEFPRRGLWTLGFLTGRDQGEAQKKTGHDVINVYIPTTPNPTGGYFVMVPKEDVQVLDMSVDDGLKMLMSMGAVVPGVSNTSSELAPKGPKP